LSYNLCERIDRLRDSYQNQPASAIYGTKEKTFELSMTEKFHAQKISLINGMFIQRPYEAEEEVKNRWKK
jgi:hypothetical protein